MASKFIAPLFCKKDAVPLLKAEIEMNLLRFKLLKDPSLVYSEITITTPQGKFTVKDTAPQITIVNPAFESDDIKELIERIRSKLVLGKDVVFIDIGAGFGKYTIIVGNALKKFQKKIRIISFEPDTKNSKLLKINTKDNNLKNVLVKNIALSNKKGKVNFYFDEYYGHVVSIKSPHSRKLESFTTERLDNYMNFFNKKSAIFIKIDIEGHEEDMLKGAHKFFNTFDDITLLIEDMNYSQGKFIALLKKYFAFSKKLTPYNSFWIKRKTHA